MTYTCATEVAKLRTLAVRYRVFLANVLPPAVKQMLLYSTVDVNNHEQQKYTVILTIFIRRPHHEVTVVQVFFQRSLSRKIRDPQT